jgi:hypothetical protein
MNNGQHGSIVSFVWGIADDILRDVYVREKYRDVTFPMIVTRRGRFPSACHSKRPFSSLVADNVC